MDPNLPIRHRVNPDLKEVAPTTVLLCRGGETDSNMQKRFEGLLDIELNNAGIEQCGYLANALRDRSLSAVWTSPLRRAVETGRIITEAAGVPLHEDPRLRERDLGVMQGLTYTEVETKYPKFWQAWKTTGMSFPPEARVEHGTEAVIRMESTIFDLAEQYPGGTVAVITHGALIRVLLHQAVGTASITTLVVGPGRSWRLVKVDDAQHLGGMRGMELLGDKDATDWAETGASTQVIVCRHGETNWNLARKFQGMEDIPLNVEGCYQALQLAQTVTSQEVSAVWTSPLLRARETAVAIAANARLSLQVDDRLRERHLGVMQGRNPTEVEALYPSVMQAWREQTPLPPESEAESSAAVIERIEHALFDLADAYPAKKVAIVLHGAAIRCLLKRAVGHLRIETPKNVSLTTIIVGPGRTWTLAQVENSGHLPKLTKEELEFTQRSISKL